MSKKIDTIRWYPQHIAEMKEYTRIAYGYDTELYRLWEAIEKACDNMYIDTMDEAACLDWENFLQIKKSAEDTLKDRRRRIKGFFANSLPYTENKLRETLDALCGPDGYELVIDRDVMKVKVGIKLKARRLVDNAYELLRNASPADMIVVSYIMYNTYGRFKNMTYGEMKKYTCGQLRLSETFQEEGSY